MEIERENFKQSTGEINHWRRLIQDNALDGVIGTDENDFIVDWNRQAEIIFGWSQSEVLGRKLVDVIVPPEMRSTHLQEIKSYLENGTSDLVNRRIEVPSVRRSGEIFRMELTMVAVTATEGTLFYCFLRDITDRIRIDRERRELLDRERAARKRLESQYAITGILATANNFSDAAERIIAEIGHALGWEVGIYWRSGSVHNELVAESIWTASHDESLTVDVAKLKAIKFLKTNDLQVQPYCLDSIEMNCLNGSRIDVAKALGFKSALWLPLRRAQGSDDATLAVFEFYSRDLEVGDPDLLRALKSASHQMAQFIDRLETKEAIEKLARESQAINRVKDEFLASLSHELRTPLNAILGFAEILRDEFETLPDEEKVECIDGILRNSKAQTDMISDLLDVSRIITGKIAFAPKELSITKLAEDVCGNFKMTAQAKGVSLDLDTSRAPAMIFADPTRIQQVLWNLVSNAIKFTPESGQIKISVSTRESECVLEVQDSGAGIDPDFLPYVFDRFRQEDASITRKFGGLGLGLAISRSLIEIHGGRMTAHSAGKGMGSLFRVCIPIGQAATRTEASPKTKSPRETLRGRRILLIEDSDDGRILISRILKRAGAEVFEANSAHQARLVLKTEVPDLIVSDIGMPEESGLEFIADLRELGRDDIRGIPAIALTAYVRPEEIEGIIRAGFQTHVAKPVTRATLIKAASTVFNE